MKKILWKHKSVWSQGSFLLEVATGVVLLTVGLLAIYYANVYTTVHASNSVTDLLLDNLPVIRVGFIFNEGAIIFLFVVSVIFAYEPRKIPFVLKSTALFIIIRSLFMMLTHLAAPLNQIYIDSSDIISKVSSGDDLFFSAHTGLPFLMAIIFWNEKYLRNLFLFFTFIGGASVLLGHLHYSIDVFSALFISFGIYHMARKLFHKDYLLFRQESAA